MTSIIYNFLIYALRFKNTFLWHVLWHKAILTNSKKKITTKIHNTVVFAKAGFPYPIILRMHPEFNNPLLESAFLCFKSLQRPITIIDIGAGIGDTYFFLKANMPESSIGTFLGIEGDPFFYDMLTLNCKHLPNVYLENTLLSDRNGEVIPMLVHTHAGTASAIGDTLATAYSLDAMMQNKYASLIIDFIKIDIDGYDGKAIKGAQQLISTYQPILIFEWHPILTHNAQNDIFEAFDVLNTLGYDNFVLFNKYGTFSHFIKGVDDSLRSLAHICLNNKHHDDWHYDVVAIPKAKIDMITLAECQFAKHKPSHI